MKLDPNDWTVFYVLLWGNGTIELSHIPLRYQALASSIQTFATKHNPNLGNQCVIEVNLRMQNQNGPLLSLFTRHSSNLFERDGIETDTPS